MVTNRKIRTFSHSTIFAASDLMALTVEKIYINQILN